MELPDKGVAHEQLLQQTPGDTLLTGQQQHAGAVEYPRPVELDDLDLEALGGELTLDPDEENPEITAVFPEALAPDSPTQQSKQQTTKPEEERTPTDEQKKDESKATSDGKDSDQKKKKRKRKKGGVPEPSVGQGVTNEAAAKKRAELLEKLRQKRQLAHQVGSKGTQMMNQLGMTLNDVAEATVAESEGKRVSNDKQDAMMQRTKSMFGSVFKNMDSKQKSYLSKKTDEVSGMATDLMKKLLGGPGKDTSSSSSSSSTAKKKNKGKQQPPPQQKEETDEFDSTLDPRMDDLVRAVHEKPTKKSKPKKQNKNTSSATTTATPAATATATATPSAVAPTALPIRPRVKEAKNDPNIDDSNPTMAPSGDASAASKNQKKNKRKRDKIKQKLIAAKSIIGNPPLPPPSHPMPKADNIPLLIPA
jgi:hypothetical protein